MSTALPIIVILVAALLAFGAGAVLARRKGYTKTGEVIARCRQGHLFTTVWAGKTWTHHVDLGWARIQRCPVGNHLTLVVRVDESELTPEETRLARKNRDPVSG